MLRSRTVREGSVGLFALLGLILFGGLSLWLRGIDFTQNSYSLIVEFENTNGIQVGAPVRYRGVDVGRITDIRASTNGVEVFLNIASTDLRIPKDVTIQTNRTGLIGEASIDITPLKPLSSKAQAISPIALDCNTTLILCDQQRLQGQLGLDPLTSFAKVSEIYTDPKFVKNFFAATEGAAIASKEIIKLSKELSVSSKVLLENLKDIPETTRSIARVANRSSELVNNLNGLVLTNRGSLTQTLNNSSALITNLNNLVQTNRGNLVQTLTSIEQTSSQLGDLVGKMELSVNQVNTSLKSQKTKEIIQNLETLTANAAEASTNLRDMSKNLNDPANLLVIQETLDSARVTFENTQKLTSDLDELIGDPKFRDNIRNLINGLGNLLSSTQELYQQVQTAQLLESVSQQLQEKSQIPPTQLDQDKDKDNKQ